MYALGACVGAVGAGSLGPPLDPSASEPSAPSRTDVPSAAEEPSPDEQALEIRLWRAGRAIPPGLSAGRAAELAAERGRALEVLARSTSRTDEALWRRWLSDPETPDELWCVAARAAAALGRYDLAGLLAQALQPSAGARRTVVARDSLHRLYGTWFQHHAELEPYLAAVQGGSGTGLLVSAVLREEERARQHLLAELAVSPERAVEWLDDPDPEIRSGAARILGRVFATEGAEASAPLEALIVQLETEYEPRAFHEELLAACAPLERSPVDDSPSTRLRAVLIDVARQPAEPRGLSVAHALTRLPWRPTGPRDLGHVLTGVEALGAMLRGLAQADQQRGIPDPDSLVAVVAALRQLCERASDLGLATELRASPVRTSLFGVLDDARQDPAARAAAAAALAPLVGAGDAPELALLLEDPVLAPQVKHALLGSMAALLTELRAGEPATSALLAAVAAQTRAEDADLRKKSLALLSDPRLETLVRGLDPAFLVECLERDSGREATIEALGLLQRLGAPGLLERVLGLERFDALCSDSTTLEALVPVLQRLAGRSRESVLAAAGRLIEAHSEPSSLARLRHALALVAGLDDPTAFSFSPAEHRLVCTWVWRATRAGVTVRDLVPGGLAFERRLLSVHLPLAGPVLESEGGLGAFESAHLFALLRADVFLGGGGGPGSGSKQEVESAFEGALAHAEVDDLRWLVLRDRARFRAAANERVKALSDYRRLAEAGAGADALLGIPDLRSAVELLERLDEAGGKGPSPTAGEACELLARLVARPAWRAEPASVRMQDLRNWVRFALESKQSAPLRRIESALADLPLTQLETQGEREPAPLWFGLTREAAWFQELLDLRVQARLGLRALDLNG